MSNIVDEIVEEPAKYAFPLIVVIAAIAFYYQLAKVNETNEKISIQLGSIDRAIAKVLGPNNGYSDANLNSIDRNLSSIYSRLVAIDEKLGNIKNDTGSIKNDIRFK